MNTYTNPDSKVWVERLVKVIAMTDNTKARSIYVLTDNKWKGMGFKRALVDLSYQGGALCRLANGKKMNNKCLSPQELSNLQNYIR